MTATNYPRPLGKREIKLHYCDNCGRRHWGRYTKYGGNGDPVEWDFEWTTPQGQPKRRAACG